MSAQARGLGVRQGQRRPGEGQNELAGGQSTGGEDALPVRCGAQEDGGFHLTIESFAADRQTGLDERPELGGRMPRAGLYP